MTPILEISNLCIGCDNCRLLCPENAVLKDQEEYSIETWSCTLCGICKEVCPIDCISFKTVETF